MALIVEEWPIGRLVDYAKNPRVNDHAIPAMVSNLTEFGFRVPILARSDGAVVDGHLRLKAARQMGILTVPVALADDLTPAQVKAFRIAVNKSATWADFDEPLLIDELSELRADGYNLELTGFDIPELAALFEDSETDGGGDGDSVKAGAGSLADRFGIAPFTVLNAREGWWQDRKRAWIALGIQSEVGRGEQSSPGGGARPSMTYSKDHARGDGHGRPIVSAV